MKKAASTSTKKTKTKTTAKKSTTVKKTKPKTRVTKKAKKKEAFTLIELLAVVIILGVVMVIGVPAVTKYVTNSRKASYVATAKTITDGAKTIVNSGEIPVYDSTVTYYLPREMIKTENTSVSPYGEFKDAYVVVTYEKNGYDYYWTSSDTTNTGINLSYYDKLDKSSVIPNVDGDPTGISVCGKDHIIVFNADGSVKEEKMADDCVEPKGVYVKEDLSTCKYKLKTQYGSFSKNGDVKEICVKLADNYTYEYYQSYYLDSRWRSGANAVLTVRFSKSDFTSSSYVRVYNNSSKETLLAEVTASTYPKYSNPIRWPYEDVSNRIQRNLGVIPSAGAWYLEMSSDLAAKNQNNHYVNIMYGTASHKTESGPWITRQSDMQKIYDLSDSLDDIDLNTVCDNDNPSGGVLFEGFDREGNTNTFNADIRVYCNGIPK